MINPSRADKHIRNLNLICPLSGIRIGSMVIGPHTTQATRCKDGSIHFYCTLHGTRGFVKDPRLLEILYAEAEKAGVHAQLRLA